MMTSPLSPTQSRTSTKCTSAKRRKRREVLHWLQVKNKLMKRAKTSLLKPLMLVKTTVKKMHMTTGSVEIRKRSPNLIIKQIGIRKSRRKQRLVQKKRTLQEVAHSLDIQTTESNFSCKHKEYQEISCPLKTNFNPHWVKNLKKQLCNPYVRVISRHKPRECHITCLNNLSNSHIIKCWLMTITVFKSITKNHSTPQPGRQISQEVKWKNIIKAHIRVNTKWVTGRTALTTNETDLIKYEICIL